MKKNNNFLEKNKIYLIIGGLLVTWICFIVFAIIPSVRLLGNNFDYVQMKMITLQNNDNKLGKLDSLRNSFEKVNAERSNLDVVFFKDNIVNLVKELELVAQNTGNDITISVDEGVNKKILEVNKNNPNSKENQLLKSLPVENYFTIKISLVGNYNSLIEFVDKLNNLKYYNTIISFNLESKEIIVMEDKSDKSDENRNKISVMNNNVDNGGSFDEEEKKKLVLNSELEVIFYSLEKNDGKK